MGIVGRLDQYASTLAWEFDETTANNPSITGFGTYYASEFNENVVETIVTSGLVLNLDAGNPASYSGSGTTLTDISGNGNNGTLVNGPTYSSANGGSIVFDGVDDRVDTINVSSLTNMTIEMWIYDTRSSGDRDILSYNGNGGSYAFNGTTFRTDGNGAGARVFGGVGNPPLNSWYRFCYVKNGDLYINQIQYTGTGTDNPYGIISLGNTRSDINNRLNGRIANTKIYNRALTAAEISQNYNALAPRYGLSPTIPLITANVFSPYDPVYDEFSGTSFGAGQGRYMRQNTDKSVIVYNEIDEITDFYGRGIVRDGLVLDLDAGISASYSGSGTTWTDLGSRGNNGTMSNVTYSSADGGSMVFNGTSSSVSNPMPSPGSVPITFDFWINSNTSTPAGIFDTAPGQANVLRQFSDAGAGRVEWWNNSPSVLLGVSALTWTNITIEYSFTTNRTIKYYRNGNLITTATGSTSPTFSWTSLIFGNINGGGSGWYSGKISTIKIYNRVLSAAEVLQNYNALRGRYGL
jgi:hypothetical protein